MCIRVYVRLYVYVNVSFILLRLNEISDFRDGFLLLLGSFILLRLLDIPNLFCEIYRHYIYIYIYYNVI